VTRRIAAFVAALATLWIVVASPVSHLDHHLLTAHMAQHLLLMLVAAPLVLFALRPHWRPNLVVSWLAGSLTVIVWHVPAVFELALSSPFWHALEQASFLVAGIVFWLPAIHSGLAAQGWSLPVYFFLATLPCDALSAFLAFCGHVVYPPYSSGHRPFGLSPLDDQALAGALMWVTVTFAYLIPALVLTSRLLSGEPRSSALEIRSSAPSSLRTTVLDLWTLTKPEVNFLIVIATFTGFYLGLPHDLHAFPFGRLLNTLLGTLLVASGTGTLNQVIEHRFDAQMRRTSKRPVAAGRISVANAAWFGILLSIAGALYLLLAVNALASALAALTLLTYLFIYTPLKRKTPLCTLVGAFPGAMPPLIGWAAASGSIASGRAWMLYALLFLWQFPHFMAIAWMYREDYYRAGYLIFPKNNAVSFLGWLTLLPSVGLLILSLASASANTGGILEYFAVLILASGLLYYAGEQVLLPSRIAARQLLKASIVYLPLEFLVVVLGKSYS
jgi:protoheme IX farnesyltransferase